MPRDRTKGSTWPRSAPQACPRRLRRPSISVCMIVRNEEANLRGCLESLKPLAAELIVVDTGSADATPAIAAEMGASVRHFPWVDDFAAARNESLHRATGDWILWMDADDRLPAETAALLSQTIAQPAADAYSCIVVSRHPDGSASVVEHLRLFRNGLGVRFSGAIHESPVPDVVRLGLRVARTEGVIEHTGYESTETRRNKSARNLAMVEQQLAVHPDDPELIFYRGLASINLDDLDGADRDMRAYLAATMPAATFEPKRFEAFSLIAQTLSRNGRLAEIEPVLDAALAEFPNHPNYLGIQGRLRLAMGRPADALPPLLSALRELQTGSALGFRPPVWAIEANIAECHRELGELSEALEWAKRAAADAPACQKQCEALLAQLTLMNRIAAVAGVGSPTGSVAPGQIEGLMLMAAGEWLHAAEQVATSAQRDPTNPDNFRLLAVALNALGQSSQAQSALELAAQLRGHAQ